MNNPENSPVGRCLRSGLKPNFRPDFKQNNRKNGKKSQTVAKSQLRVLKSVTNDPKLWLPSTVDIKRLNIKTIKKYDKIFFMKHKKRLKAERVLSKYSKIRQSLSKGQSKPKQTANSNNTESPKRMLLWTSPVPQTKQQTNHPLLRSHVKRLVEFDNRENSLMSLPEFCRNLDLISFNDINRMNTKQMNTSFKLRNIAKTDDYSVDQFNKVEINYEYLFGCVDQNQEPNSSQTLDTNQKKKKDKKNLWNVTKVKKKYKQLEQHKRKLAELWKKTYLNTLSSYEMSSPMGRRIFMSIQNQTLEEKKVQSIIRRYESFCGTRLRLPQTDCNQFNRWKAHTIESWTTDHELPQNDGPPDCHQYSFTRRQRLEKLLRFECGIDWRSRLLALNCNSNAKILVKKLMFCQFCGQHIDSKHNCDNNASDGMTRSDTSDGLKQQTLKNIDSNQRVLRNLKKVVSNSKVNAKTKKMIPKTKVSPKKVKKLRICLIDLDKSF